MVTKWLYAEDFRWTRRGWTPTPTTLLPPFFDRFFSRGSKQNQPKGRNVSHPKKCRYQKYLNGGGGVPPRLGLRKEAVGASSCPPGLPLHSWRPPGQKQSKEGGRTRGSLQGGLPLSPSALVAASRLSSRGAPSGPCGGNPSAWMDNRVRAAGVRP